MYIMNSVNLVGRLTKDPELKNLPSGVAVARFTLAVDRLVKKEGQPTADFIQVQVWAKTAENAAKYIKKGSLVSVTGRIQTGSYDGTDGKKVFTTEVQGETVRYLEKASGTQTTENQPAQNQQSNQSNQNNQSSNDDPFTSGSGPIEVSDDDLPF
jgi:single-strand DNA-binding protein